MPIIGAGTDIVEISRVQQAVSESFLRRYFSDAENELFRARGMKPETIAVNFAAKEAFSKALGSGFAGIQSFEIEILRDENGRPRINLYGTAKAKAASLGVKQTHVSLSHSGDTAIAFVVLES